MMDICDIGHSRIVHDSKFGCPMCQLVKHNNQVHDFIESKGQKLIKELVQYQKDHKEPKS